MKAIAIGEIFALPLQSAVRAQNLAFQEAITAIEQIGLEEGKAKVFSFMTERMVEERVIDAKTGEPRTQFRAQPFEISLPLLAMVPLPGLRLQEMNVEFGVDVVEPKAEPIKTAIISPAALGSSLAASPALFSKGSSNPAPSMMKVTMKIVQNVPEGMSRINDMLADLVSGRAVDSAQSPPAEKAPVAEEKVPPVREANVQEIRGIGPETAAILKGKGISTIEEFLEATETAESKADFASAIGRGISPQRIETWREAGRLVLKGKEAA